MVYFNVCLSVCLTESLSTKPESMYVRRIANKTEKLSINSILPAHLFTVYFPPLKFIYVRDSSLFNQTGNNQDFVCFKFTVIYRIKPPSPSCITAFPPSFTAER